MTLTRRYVLAASLAAPAIVGLAGRAKAARTIKISHQFPGGSLEEGDFRDRLCRIFARDIAKKTDGALTGEVYPNSSLMKTNAQFSALRKGALDASLYPMPYAGGEVPELNIGLMPALVTTYEQAAGWKNAPVGRKLTKIMEDKGVVMLSWIWQAGGVASRERPIVVPDDAKGQKVRGGSREMDLMFQRAGAAVLSLPSNESYAAMQTGAADAILTSSTSLISFRLEEIAKQLTTGRGRSYWFMCEPLMMSKAVFDSLSKTEKDAVVSIGEELEAFGTKGAKEDDERVAQVFTKAGAKTYDLDEAAIDKWRTIARETAWKDYAAKNASCAELMKLAETPLPPPPPPPPPPRRGGAARLAPRRERGGGSDVDAAATCFVQGPGRAPPTPVLSFASARPSPPLRGGRGACPTA